MEGDPAAPRTDADFDPVPLPGPDPEHVTYRRRQGDWLSDGSLAGSPGDESESAARRAAIELAKATLIARDGLTSDHSDDVGLMCEAIAEQLGLEEPEQADLMAAAQLHDIGKVAVPESILRKPALLTEDEWDVIHEHTVVGEQILNAVPELRDVALFVRHSHEHWDGSGYPDGLAGEEIPLQSRIILCADAFHAVRSPRPYREGCSAPEAFEEIEAHSGRQFDPAVVAALGRTIEDLRRRRFVTRPSVAVRAVLSNRRLAALLLTMAMGGSAFAAVQGDVWHDGRADASTEPPPCEGCFASQPSPFAGAPTPARRERPVARRRAAQGPRRASRPGSRRATLRGGASSPVKSAPAAPVSGRARKERPPRKTARRVGSPPVAGVGSPLATGVDSIPDKAYGGKDSDKGHGYKGDDEEGRSGGGDGEDDEDEDEEEDDDDEDDD
jgi:HD domain